jgi:hypothetical protein
MKTLSIISVALIVLFSAVTVSANTLFTKAEWAILENWNNNGAKNSIEKPEAYSASDETKSHEVKVFNTLFSKNECSIVMNWNNKKQLVKYGPAEGYSEPEGARQKECEMFNTCLSKEEWEILKNWD